MPAPGSESSASSSSKRGARKLHLLLTHLHLDHLEGLRFFAPLFDKGVSLDIWGPRSPVLSLEGRIRRSFSPPLFPIDLRDLPAQVTFRDVPLGALDARRRNPDCPPRHSSGTDASATGSRRPSRASRTCPITSRRSRESSSKSTDWISGAAIAEQADLLVHDAQYSEQEYEQKVGWGHTSVEDAVVFARAVGARRLVLFHHEPLHSDESLERIEDHARSLAGPNEEQPTLAREGMVVELP